MQSHSDRKSSVRLGQTSGPLYSYIPGFTASLTSRGYSKPSIAYRLTLRRDLDGWMRQRRMGIEEFSEERIRQFLRYRRKRDSKRRGDNATLRSLLKHLRKATVVGPPVSQDQTSPLNLLQASFAQYLREQRGLRPTTLEQYLFHTRRFLSERFGKDALSVGELNAQDISRCILRQARTISPHAARCMAKALRSLLRFLHQRGDIATNLAASVPSVANWSLAGLPKYLSPQQIELVLRKCEQHDATVQRDRTILLLLARLGLRAAEVVRMTLDDIDWEAGELTIRGKGGHRDKLPLPKDVGQSLATYLKRLRPSCTCRRVFIRSAAPHEGFADSAAVDMVVQREIIQAGVYVLQV
jgi:site-specific recombinase XerD